MPNQTITDFSDFADLEADICRIERTLRMASVFAGAVSADVKATNDRPLLPVTRDDLDCLFNILAEAVDSAHKLRTDFYAAHAQQNATARAA